MSETKFTPGPWRQNKYGSIGAGDNGSSPIVAIVEFEFGDVPLAAQSPHNSNLIAAAPELYHALETLVRDAQDYEAWQRPCNAVMDAIAALAKARGESV